MNSDRKLQRSCHVDQFTFHKERPISNAYSKKKKLFFHRKMMIRCVIASGDRNVVKGVDMLRRLCLNNIEILFQ